MGVPELRRPFAVFECQECSTHYEDLIPAIFIDLPACPVCAAESQIYQVFDYTWEVLGRWDERPFS